MVMSTDDQVTNVANMFRNHSTIIMIKNKKKNDQSFSFGPVTYDDVLKIVNTLDTAKASQQSDIPTKISKKKIQTISQNVFTKISTSVSQNQYSHQI